MQRCKQENKETFCLQEELKTGETNVVKCSEHLSSVKKKQEKKSECEISFNN